MQAKSILGVIAIGLLTASCAPQNDDAIASQNNQVLKEEARQAAGRLGAELKARLVAAMEEGGPVKGIEVCSEIAPEIARKVSEETGLEIGRTALKFRNPGNAPDEFETYWLKAFIADMDAGKPVANLEGWAESQDGGQRTFRWMKPIEMGGLCQTCHGTDIASDVQMAIDAAYPEDGATGFAPGDLRGAFTVRKVLE